MVDTIDINKMAEMISEACTVTRHDILAVLSAFGPVMSRSLQQSMKVYLKDLGTFKLGVRTIGEQDADDFDARKNVKSVHVLFHPETVVNANGKWENQLTRGTRVAELPKNLREVADNDDSSDTPGEDTPGEDRP